MPRAHFCRLCSQFLVLATAMLPIWAAAGSFQVSPVRVELSPNSPTATLSVRNESQADDVVVQLRTVSWRQENGEDIYTPTSELIATPPIFTLKPGSTQTLRLGMRKVTQSDVQQTFRIYITEVPPPPKEGFQGLQVALNIGIPVFVAPKSKNGLPPLWKARMGADGKLALTITNPANAHIQVLDINVWDGDDPVAVAVVQQPRYIHAGQSATWSVAVTHPPRSKMRVTARSDSGSIDSEVLPDSGAH